MALNTLYLGFITCFQFPPGAVIPEDAQLFQEVMHIIESGLTVEKVESQRLHDERERALLFAKESSNLSQDEWELFLINQKKIIELNTLFKLDQPDGTKAYISPEAPEELVKALHQKLKARNLNPDAVGIVIDDHTHRTSFACALQQVYWEADNPVRVENILLFNKNALPCIISWLDYSLDHEITHLEKHHVATHFLLMRYIDFNSLHCLIPHSHACEFEANVSSGLKNLDAAYASKIYMDDYEKNEEYYQSTPTHPSLDDFCKQSNRIVKMLEFEKKLLRKKDRQLATFDPALNG